MRRTDVYNNHMSTPPTVSISIVRVLAAGVAAARFDPGPLLAEVGVDRALLDDPDARVRHDQVVALWRRGPSYTGDENLGLHGAEFVCEAQMALGVLDVFDYLAQSSATLGQALDHFSRFSRLLREDLLDISVTTSAVEAVVVPRLLDVPSGSLRHAAECCLAAITLRIRRALGSGWAPREVRFQHAAPRTVNEHRRIFGTAVRFDHELDCLVLDRADLDRPLSSADPRLQRLLERQAAALLARVPPADDLLQRLRRVLIDSVRGGDVSIGSSSKRLGISLRSLQRRLSEQSLSYRALVEQVRMEQALQLLEQRHLSIAEIAFLLGFSGPPGFHRAFRRWTGETPGAYRKRKSGTR